MQVNRIRYITEMAILICLGFLLVSCAPQDQVNMLEMRVNTLDIQNQALTKKVEVMNRQLNIIRSDLKEVGKKDIASVRQTLANLSNRLDELQAEQMRINGLIDQINYQHKQDYQKINQQINQIQAQLDNIQQELKLLEASNKVTQQVEQTRKEIAQGKVDLYHQALELFNKGEYEQAEKMLRAYINQNPKGLLVPNAYFWIGECEYRMQRYEEAILDYQKVISEFPQSNKVPDALLKQGLAFVQLGDTNSAKIVLEKLIKLYPNSPQARVAKKQLKMIE